MRDWLFQIRIELEPSHSQFGEIMHIVRAIGYVHADTLETARKKLDEYCRSCYCRIVEVTRSGPANEIAYTESLWALVHVEKARRFGCALEMFGVDAKKDLN